jgi:hypothetical protein
VRGKSFRPAGAGQSRTGRSPQPFPRKLDDGASPRPRHPPRPCANLRNEYPGTLGPPYRNSAEARLGTIVGDDHATHVANAAPEFRVTEEGHGPRDTDRAVDRAANRYPLTRCWRLFEPIFGKPVWVRTKWGEACRRQYRPFCGPGSQSRAGPGHLFLRSSGLGEPITNKFDGAIAPGPTLRCEVDHTGPNLSGKGLRACHRLCRQKASRVQPGGGRISKRRHSPGSESLPIGRWRRVICRCCRVRFGADPNGVGSNIRSCGLQRSNLVDHTEA